MRALWSNWAGAVAELRELYIKARYQGWAARTEAKRAKELYKRIKRSATPT